MPPATLSSNLHSSAIAAETPPRPPGRLVLALASATASHGLCSALIAAVLPAVQARFPGVQSGTWVTSGFFVAAALAAPIGGRLADLLGPRRIAVGGLVLIAVASALAATAMTPAWLVAARAATGVGTAVQYPAALGMLRRHAPSHANAGLAGIALASEVAFASAPSLGAFVLDWGGWRAALASPCVLALIAIVLVLIGVDGERVPWPGFRRLVAVTDLPGLAVFCAAVIVVLVWLLALPQGVRWTLLAVLPILFGLLWIWEREFAPAPFLPPGLASHRVLALTLFRSLIFFCSFYVLFYALPTWLTGHGLTPTQIALVMLPLPVVATGSCLLARKLLQRGHARWTLVIGAAGLLAAAMMAAFLADAPVGLALAIAGLLAVPAGLVNVANQSLLYHHAPTTRTSAVGGIYRTFQFVGGGVSAAVLQLTGTAEGLARIALVVGLGALTLMTTSVIDPAQRRDAPAMAGTGSAPRSSS
jgi:MFS family permease